MNEDWENYWSGVGVYWKTHQPDRLWRRFADHLQVGWIERCLPKLTDSNQTQSRQLLKTDLFDEVAGDGIVSHLQAAGWIVTGVDISAMIVAETAARFPELKGVVADVRSLPFEDCSFDVVFSGSTLDHFESSHDIEVSLQELVRVLCPGGTLILTLDNLANPLVFIRNGPILQFLRRCGIVPYQVGVTVGPNRLARMVQKAGLVIAEKTAIMHVPRVIAVAIAKRLQRSRPQVQQAFLRYLANWEWLEHWPTRFITGYYIAIHATKPLDLPRSNSE